MEKKSYVLLAISFHAQSIQGNMLMRGFIAWGQEAPCKTITNEKGQNYASFLILLTFITAYLSLSATSQEVGKYKTCILISRSK